MRILVYKRTHIADSDPLGCFGVCDCMGKVRKRKFDAVVGVGGVGATAKASGIAGDKRLSSRSRSLSDSLPSPNHRSGGFSLQSSYHSGPMLCKEDM
jgi:hypothetical protein